MSNIILGEQLTAADVHRLVNVTTKVVLPDQAKERVEACVDFLNSINQDEQPIYGISTGFGYFQNKWINHDEQKQLQINLIRSHSAGTGEPIPKSIVRTAMILLANSLAKGYSGIRLATLELLIDLINKDLIPVTYSIGSLGASGDLAPLAHMALTLVGEGEIWSSDQHIPSDVALQQHNLHPIKLLSKEGLALINGTHFMTAYALHILHRSRNLIMYSLLASGLTIETLKGTDLPFSSLVCSVRQHAGHRVVAETMQRILADSQIIISHRDPKFDHKVQDPYVLRCIPQVVGAIWDAFAYLERTVEVEINSVTDNPLIFVDEQQVISAGNFHGEPLALPLDSVGIALVELANLTEGRISRLNNPFEAELKAFLADNPGLESGYMIAHYAVAAIVNRLRVLAHPASADNIPVSGGQEDHVSMGMTAATKTLEILQLVEEVVANEMFMAARGLNFNKVYKSSTILEKLFEVINTEIPHVPQDHIVRSKLQAAVNLLRSGKLEQIFNLLPLTFQ